MNATDHIIAWIESDAAHYAKLCEIARRRQPGCVDGYISDLGPVYAALVLVHSAYFEMLRTGDADRDDRYSSIELARAVPLICEWELPA